MKKYTINLASLYCISNVALHFIVITSSFLLIAWGFAIVAFPLYKSPLLMMFEWLLGVVLVSGIGIFFFFSIFKKIEVGINGTIVIKKRWGSDVSMQNNEMQLFRIYKLSLMPLREPIGIVKDRDVFPLLGTRALERETFLLRMQTCRKNYYCLIDEFATRNIEKRIKKGILTIPNYQEAAIRTFSQGWYWLILFIAIILIIGFSTAALMFSK